METARLGHLPAQVPAERGRAGWERGPVGDVRQSIRLRGSASLTMKAFSNVIRPHLAADTCEGRYPGWCGEVGGEGAAFCGRGKSLAGGLWGGGPSWASAFAGACGKVFVTSSAADPCAGRGPGWCGEVGGESAALCVRSKSLAGGLCGDGPSWAPACAGACGEGEEQPLRVRCPI